MAFNLETALREAGSGNVAQWESIARHFLKKKPAKKRATKKATGPQTWAHVILADGREFLTSAYERATPELTNAAHCERAQYRGRMEDSGDNGVN